MLIALDERTLNQNIVMDGLVDGSAAGDIILIQDTVREPFDDRKYSSLPDIPRLHNEKSFKSVKNPKGSIIHKVMVSTEILVNGTLIDCGKAFVSFIRESKSGKKKVTFVCQETRKLDKENVDNKAVLNAISEYLGYRSYTVEALEYINSNRLNFIVFDRGDKVDASKVFVRKDRILRGIKGYHQNEINNWSGTEFGVACAHILRRYSLCWLTKLLKDDIYCSKRFGDKIVSDDAGTGYLSEQIDLDGEMCYIRNVWNDNVKNAFFNWLLDRIAEKSSDVFDITYHDKVKSLRIPDRVSGIDYDAEQIEIAYSVAGGSIKKDIDVQEIYQQDNVFLTDEKVTRLLSYSCFFVKYMKEQSIILKKKEGTSILASKENDVLDLIRKGDL